MSVSSSDLVAYAAAVMPEDDTTGSVGGAIDTTTRIVFVDLTANDTIEAVSDNAGDTMNLTVYGRDTEGAIQSETKALTGTAAITFSTLGTIERFMRCSLASAASGTVTVRDASSDTAICTLSGTVTDVRRMFYDSSSESGITTRYEKFFFRNNNSTDALTNATVELTDDPSSGSSNIQIATETTTGGSNTAANRETAPASGVNTFIDTGSTQTVGSGTLGASTAIGVWVKLVREADASAIKDTFEVTLAGNTT